MDKPREKEFKKQNSSSSIMWHCLFFERAYWPGNVGLVHSGFGLYFAVKQRRAWLVLG